MSQHTTFSGATGKSAGGVLLAAAAAGAVAAAMSSAGTASATCASISGIGNGNGCTSTATSFAIGIGSGTTADANGLFSGAIANGLTNTGTQSTQAFAKGNFSLAYAGGPNTLAATNGTLNVAVAQGSNVLAQAGNLAQNGDTANVAINIANEPASSFGNSVFAGGGPTKAGIGNVALNLGGTGSATRPNEVFAIGTGNLGAQVLGSGNLVFVGGAISPATLSSAFAFGGTNNNVNAGPGPSAIAGEINQTGKTITQTGPGININNM